MSKILIIIGHEGFRDEEYFEPKKVFENAGHQVVTSSKKNPAVSKISKESVKVDVLFGDLVSGDSDYKIQDFDVIVFVGGPGAQTYLEDKDAHKLAWDFYEARKLVAAICLAPVILANAGLLIGKSATVWPGAKADLCAGNCIYRDDEVVTDGRIITADGPEAAKKFAETIVKKLTRIFSAGL